jgi:integrase
MPIVNLTDTAKTEGSRLEIRDKKVRGLELRVSPTGSKRWVLRYRRKSDGTKRTHTLGQYPDMSLERARQSAQDARRDIATGGDPADDKRAWKASEPFRQVVAEWQKSHAEVNRSERVRKDDESMLKRYILPWIGDMKAGDLTRRELSKMLNDAKAATDGRKGHKKKGRNARRLTHRPNSVFGLTRAIIRWAVEQGIMTADPTLGMKRPLRKEVPRERELSPPEIVVFWKGLEGLAMTQGLRIALRLALVTAQRIGKVTGIAKDELVLDGLAPVWSLPRERTKNNEATRVPLSPLAVELIREAWGLSGDSPWLFPSRTTDVAIDGHAATTAILRGRAKLALKNFRVHDLRRTAATRMAEMGVNPYTVSLVLNHISTSKSTITSKVYLKYQFDREKREALHAWGARLERIIAGTDASDVAPLSAAQRQEAC